MSDDRAAVAAGDRGAVLVEFAFVLPILAMLLFGVVSAGMAWNQNLALGHGARIGARYAATLPTTDYATMDAYLDAVAARVVASSEGNLDSGIAGRIVCVAYVYPAGTTSLDRTRSRTETGSGVTRSDSPCFSDGQTSTERRVQVSSQRSATFETGLWSRTITLQQQIVFRYEVTSGL